MCHFFFIVIISPKCPTTVWFLSASGVDERGTRPLDKAVSHTDPSENTLSRGLLWDTLAKGYSFIFTDIFADRIKSESVIIR